MKIQCPSCRTEYEVDNSYLDQEVECPKCNETFTVSMSMLIVDSTTNTAKDKKIEIPKPSNCVYSSEGNPSKEGEESLTNGNSSSKGYSKYLILESPYCCWECSYLPHPASSNQQKVRLSKTV
ncbi:MAG: zinc-ribbon domain-containing protein [Victivallales bacterium]|nr:zinc-ribbon domain-containing protein [Victivallales bacterium]